MMDVLAKLREPLSGDPSFLWSMIVAEREEAAAEIERLRKLLAENMAKDCGVYTAARDEYCKAMAEQAAKIERLRAALERMLLEFDFMVEGNIISDVRDDVIFVQARAALAKTGEINDQST